MTKPDCIADGAEPCVGYLELQERQLTAKSSLAALQREYSRIAELIRQKVCGDPSVTVGVRP